MGLLMIDFPGHVLRGNENVGIPRHVIYLDTETHDRPAQEYVAKYMYLAWTCLCRYDVHGNCESEKWQAWQSDEKMWRYIDNSVQKYTAMYLFAHNAFFDLQASGFFKYFARWGWILEFFYEKGLTYILSAGQQNRTIRVLSSTNFYECSLAELGSMIGKAKKGVDFEHTTDKILSAYCRQDAEILKAGMEKWFKFVVEHKLGRFALTKSSQAMHAYRHRFMPQKITFHTHEKAAALERESYFGGRCECFELGDIKEGPFVTLDVNSMYPFCMSIEPVPIRLVDFLSSMSMEKLHDCLYTFCVVARVDLECDKPLFAFRHKEKVIFPVGRFSCVLTTPSLREALQRGYIRKIGESYLYEKDLIFSDYVEYFHKLKQLYTRERRAIERYAVKNMLNSLYGKFAQQKPITEENIEEKFESYFKEEILDLVTGKTETVTKMLNRRVITFGLENDKRCFTAIAAHVTDAARMYLWKLIEPLWPDRILYCDTDSLKLRKSDIELVLAPIANDQLGSLKIESTVDRLQIFAPKSYQADRERVIKGVPKRACQMTPVSYSYLAFLKQNSHLRLRRDHGVLTHEVFKTLKNNYDKGIVTPSGRVMPFELEFPGLA
jgi:hypothetical protein